MESEWTYLSNFPFEDFDYRYLAANMKYHKLDGKAIIDMDQEEINKLIEAIWYSFPEVTRGFCIGRPESLLPK